MRVIRDEAKVEGRFISMAAFASNAVLQKCYHVAFIRR